MSVRSHSSVYYYNHDVVFFVFFILSVSCLVHTPHDTPIHLEMLFVQRTAIAIRQIYATKETGTFFFLLFLIMANYVSVWKNFTCVCKWKRLYTQRNCMNFYGDWMFKMSTYHRLCCHTHTNTQHLRNQTHEK